MAKKFNKKGIEIEEIGNEPMDEAVVAAVEAAPEELVDFETWYSQREAAIPAHHHREIIKADFAGRKVPAQATMAQFDDALKKYGVKLA